jgi:23S rRNA pseudouridine955/2504/2580 synthase
MIWTRSSSNHRDPTINGPESGAVAFWSMNTANRIRVSREEEGQKLYQFLVRRLGKHVPKAALMRWIRTGQIRVDSARAKPFDRLAVGQEVRLPPQALPSAHFPAPYQGPVPQIIHEDDDLLVLNKPSGLPVHAGSGHSFSLHDWTRATYNKALFTPTPVHRLDRDTSGVLVLAKSYSLLRRMHDLWKSGEVLKLYLCWVAGEWESKSWVRLSDRLKKQETGGRELVVAAPGGKEALSLVKTVSARQGSTLLAVRIHTGRTHQIRSQLASRGYPVLGDKKYGGPALAEGMLLHCWHLSWEGQGFTVGPKWGGPFAVPSSLTPEDIPA